MDCNLLDLPQDVIIYIVKYFDINEFIQFMTISKYALDLLNSNMVWNYYLETTYNDTIHVLPREKSEKEKFILCHELNNLLKYYNFEMTLVDVFILQKKYLNTKQLQRMPQELQQLLKFQTLYLQYNQMQ